MIVGTVQANKKRKEVDIISSNEVRHRRRDNAERKDSCDKIEKKQAKSRRKRGADRIHGESEYHDHKTNSKRKFK